VVALGVQAIDGGTSIPCIPRQCPCHQHLRNAPHLGLHGARCPAMNFRQHIATQRGTKDLGMHGTRQPSGRHACGDNSARHHREKCAKQGNGNQVWENNVDGTESIATGQC